MEVYPERQKRQKTRFVCNFNRKSVFRCTQRAITQRRIITLGPIFIKMVLNRAQGLKEKSQEVSAQKNNNPQRYNKKCRMGADSAPPPGSFRVKLHLIMLVEIRVETILSSPGLLDYGLTTGSKLNIFTTIVQKKLWFSKVCIVWGILYKKVMFCLS